MQKSGMSFQKLCRRLLIDFLVKILFFVAEILLKCYNFCKHFLHLEAFSMAETNEKNFGLKEGMKVELLTEEQVFLLNGVIDKIDDEAVWVTNASGDIMPVIIHNTQVRINGIRADGSIVILHGAICGNSDNFWKIDRISHFSFSNQRSDYRHSIYIQTTVNRLVILEGENGEEYIPTPPEEECTIHNISGGGLMFSSFKQFYPDDSVRFAPITLLDGQEAFTLNCQILRVDNHDGKYFYGCQFFDLDTKEQQRLISQIFTLQAAEIRRKNRL